MRILLGLLFTPAFIPLIAWFEHGSNWALKVAGITYLYILVLGIPSSYFFVRRGWTKWWQCILAGVLASAPLLFIFSVFMLLSLDFTNLLGVLAVAFIGGVGGFVFWLIAFLRVEKR